jgi:outer membrane protein assembly factor BamD
VNLNVFRKASPILFLAALAFGCAKQMDITRMEPDAAYRYLEGRYNKGDYLAAVDGLDYFTLNYSGSALVDSAQFLLAESHAKLKEYLLAAEAYNELARRFTRSPLVPEAMYQAGVCYYKLSPKYTLDQEYTNKAIDALQAFIDYYPTYTTRTKDAQRVIGDCRDKLAHKEFASGVIYLKMKDYQAAAIYFQTVIDKYYDTQWAAESSFRLGEAYSGDGKNDDAVEAYHNFLSKYPDHPSKDKAVSALAKLAKKNQ